MKLENAYLVRNILGLLDDLSSQVREILSGYVDATIYGKYFGDYLPDDEYEKLREIALRHVARQYWTAMQNLKTLHGVDVEFPDWHVDSIDSLIAYWKSQQETDRRPK